MSFKNTYKNCKSRYDLDPERIYDFAELTYILLAFERGTRVTVLRTPKGEILPAAISDERRDIKKCYAHKYYPDLYQKPKHCPGNHLSDANQSRSKREEKEMKDHVNKLE